MGSPDRKSSAKDGTKMDWMYKGPAALVDRDDYLKGRSIDKSLKMLDEAEKGHTFSYADEVEKDLTPVSIFSSRGQAGPIDVIRKIKEDPLFQIQKKEEESLRQLLNNPVRMKRLREMAEKNKKVEDKLRKSGDRKNRKKKRGTSSSSSSSSDDSTGDADSDGDANIDRLLAEKLTSMKDVKAKLVTKRAMLSASSESSSDEDRKNSGVNKRSKHENNDKHRDRQHSSSHTTSAIRVGDLNSDRSKRYERDSQRYDRDRYSNSSNPRDRDRDQQRERERDRDRDRYRDSNRDKRDRDERRSRDRDETRSRDRDERRSRDRDERRSRDRDERRSRDRDERTERPKNYTKYSSASSARPHPPVQQRKPLDDAERERRMKEMMDNAKWREENRTLSVNKQREEIKKEEDKLKKEHNADFIRKQLVEAATTGSVEKRIKSNSYNIQRSKSSMNQNFAKR